MADSNDAPRDEHRRAALRSLGAGMVATAVGGAAAADRGAPPARGQAAGGAYNILFILTDQERYFRPGELPRDYRLPAHERLAQTRHRVREPPHQLLRVHVVALGDLHRSPHPAHEDVRQHELPLDAEPVDRHPHDRPPAARGRLLHRLQGQVAPDQGVRDRQQARLRRRRSSRRRWRPTASPTTSGVGDIIAHTAGRLPARRHDRRDAAELAARPAARTWPPQGKPWFLAVNLVNPHDVMFYDTDEPGAAGAGEERADPHRAAIRPIRCTRSSGSSSCRRASRSRSTRPAARPRTPTTSARTTRWSGRSRATRRGAGASGTTSTSTACATSTATSSRCSTSSTTAASRRTPSSC